MSRAMENYICASEDRSHYNTDTCVLLDYWPDPLVPIHYPVQIGSYEEYPQSLVDQNPANIVINETVIQQNISQEEIIEIINNTIPQLAETLAEKLGTIITEADLDAAIDEIYGGSASSLIGGTNGV